jgi:GTP-binding protein Era
MSAQTPNLSETRCAFIALAGQPNAGKSTLLNALVGARVGIISAKPNTTRLLVRGVQNLGATQLVWLDTPGLAENDSSAKRGFSRQLQQQAQSALSDADVVVLVVETTKALRDLAREERWMQQAVARKQPVILALAQVDKLSDKKALLPLLTKLQEWPLAAVIPLSATKGTAVKELAHAVAKLAPVGPHHFPPEMVTDQPVAERLAELTREQLMRLLQAEVPYGITVQTEAIEAASDPDPMLVQQSITVQLTRHKPMVLGAGGLMLKRLGTQARHAMQEVLGQGVRLELRVKVAKN